MASTICKQCFKVNNNNDNNINSIVCQFTNDFAGKTVSFSMVYLASCQ